jgi:hypothetical protein
MLQIAATSPARKRDGVMCFVFWFRSWIFMVFLLIATWVHLAPFPLPTAIFLSRARSGTQLIASVATKGGGNRGLTPWRESFSGHCAPKRFRQHRKYRKHREHRERTGGFLKGEASVVRDYEKTGDFRLLSLCSFAFFFALFNIPFSNLGVESAVRPAVGPYRSDLNRFQRSQ